MSDEARSINELDEDLSALLDGELPAEREATLRARIEADPRLAARLSELAAVDDSLRTLPRREPSAGLGVATRERIAAESAGPGRPLSARGRAPLRPSGRRVWPVATVAAAAAAAVLLLVLVLGRGGELAPPATPFEAELAAASDEDLEIALELETLSVLSKAEELELIESLELLELLADLDPEEPG